jgi:trk system potassium uptake protein TrkA
VKVIICGAGRVGYGIAERLAAEDNDVSVIDTSATLVQAIRDTLDVRSYVGHGAIPTYSPGRRGPGRHDHRGDPVRRDQHGGLPGCAFDVRRTHQDRPNSRAVLPGSHWADLFSRDHLPIDVIISPEVEVGDVVLRRIAFAGRDRYRAVCRRQGHDGGDRMPRGLPGHQYAAGSS